MRLASFNIKNGLADDGSCDPDALVGACRGLRADVLALQEVDRDVPRSNRADQTAIVAARCGLTGLYAPARGLDGGEYGNALLVRGSIADVEHVRLPVMPGNEARAVVVACVEVDGVALSVAATHLQNRVLLGDLNMPPEVAVPALEAAGYEVADSEPTVVVGAPKFRIDYVAVDGLAVGASEVHDTDVSDHRALIVEVAVPDSEVE